MSSLSTKFWREVIEFLRCFFVVINENEPALIITTKYMSTVSAGVLEILLPLTRFSAEFEEKSGSSQTLGFFSNYRLTKGFPHALHRLFRPSKEQQLGKNSFHLR